jgi:DNA-directed RNA polymerase
MARMTEEEADALDEFVTNNEITLGPNGSGWLSLHNARLVGMDDVSTAWLRGRAEAAHTSVGQIINEMVHEKIAAAAE